MPVSSRLYNRQMFALASPPPAELHIAGVRYALVRVFKHDFWAATTLYEAPSPAPHLPLRVVVKMGRVQPFWGLPLSWVARWQAEHEESIYRALAGLPGVPRWLGRVGRLAYAIEYIDARPLDHPPPPPPGYFDAMARLMEAIHARGVAYCDANKRSNMLVGPGGEPFLIDFQISIRRRDDWLWPLRGWAGRLVDYMSGKDFYHLYKIKRRMAPAETTPSERAASRHLGGWHELHRRLTKPYRSLRRAILSRLYAKGKLNSPTAGLEDHYQPEKETWRK